MVDYPEHEKLKKVQERSQSIGEFIDWLSEKKLCVCEYIKDEIVNEEGWFPANKSTEKLLAEFFNIDLGKIESEKQQMLEEMRASNLPQSIKELSTHEVEDEFPMDSRGS